jgi:hypothetical protein
MVFEFKCSNKIFVALSWPYSYWENVFATMEDVGSGSQVVMFVQQSQPTVQFFKKKKKKKKPVVGNIKA